ncbi:MAG: hypothetical protein KF716_10900 [Anaerolineae bacterium]|nr:hypothetical protein [Anaerolineae bacterium]
MTDQEFIQAFESCTLTEFTHRDHIRMAWLYLRGDGTEAGLVKIRDGIRAFAHHLGADRKYHETITVFWAQVVALAISFTPDIADFTAFVATHPHLLDKSILMRHYSGATLATEAARHTWVEPDLIPLPASA